MATLEDLDAMDRDNNQDKDKDDKKASNGDDTAMQDAEAAKKPEDKPEEESLDPDILSSNTRDIINRQRLLENETRIMRSEFQRLTHEKQTMHEKIKDNMDKIENNKYVSIISSFDGY